MINEFKFKDKVHHFHMADQLAQKLLLSATKAKPRTPTAYFHLGIAEKNLGNRPAAKDAFEKAKTDPTWRTSADYELNLMKSKK